MTRRHLLDAQRCLRLSMTRRRSDGTDKQRDGGNATEESRAEQRDAEGEGKKMIYVSLPAMHYKLAGR